MYSSFNKIDMKFIRGLVKILIQLVSWIQIHQIRKNNMWPSDADHNQ